MALLLIGMDPSSSSELRQDIILSIHAVCQSVALDDNAVVNKLVSFYSPFRCSPVN